jgi:hypothetical protein
MQARDTQGAARVLWMIEKANEFLRRRIEAHGGGMGRRWAG